MRRGTKVSRRSWKPSFSSPPLPTLGQNPQQHVVGLGLADGEDPAKVGFQDVSSGWMFLQGWDVPGCGAGRFGLHSKLQHEAEYQLDISNCGAPLKYVMTPYHGYLQAVLTSASVSPVHQPHVPGWEWHSGEQCFPQEHREEWGTQGK